MQTISVGRVQRCPSKTPREISCSLQHGVKGEGSANLEEGALLALAEDDATDIRRERELAEREGVRQGLRRHHFLQRADVHQAYITIKRTFQDIRKIRG